MLIDNSEIKVINLVVGELQTNCYLVIDKKTSKILIIDSGDDTDYIERVIADNKCRPCKIIATHGHFDHLMATMELQLAYNIPFLIHQKDEFLVKSIQLSARHFLSIEIGPPPRIDGYLKEKDQVILGDIRLGVLETPGHTPGSICLYIKQQKLLFTGDLLFAGGGVGRTDFSYSDSGKLKKSLKKIFRLPADTQIFPGHGTTSTIGEEIRYHKDI